MRKLEDEEKATLGSKFHSLPQKELLKQFFSVCQYPTLQQRDVLAEKVGIETKKVNYWFDNNRRLASKNVPRDTSNLLVEGKRIRRKPPPPDLLAPRMRHLFKSDSIIEYDNSLIVKSSAFRN